MTTRNKKIAIFCSFCVSILFVFHFFVAKDVLVHVSPLALGGFRGFFGGLVILFFFRKEFELQAILKFKWYLLGIAVLGFYVNQILFLSGLKDTSPVNTSVIMNTIPLATALMAVAFKLEAFSWKKMSGVALGFSMILILTFFGTEKSMGGVSIGDLKIFVSVLTLCAATNLAKIIFQKGFSPGLGSAAMLLIGGFLLLLTGHDELGGLINYSQESWLNTGRIVFEVFISTALTYYLSFKALGVLAPSQSMIFIYLQPPFSAELEYFLYHKTPHWILIPVFLGVAISGCIVVSAGSESKADSH